MVYSIPIRLSRFKLAGPPTPRDTEASNAYAIIHDSLGPVCICRLIGINSAHDQTMDWVKGDVLPVITWGGGCWLIRVTVRLFVPHARSCLVKLPLPRLRGKTRRGYHGALWHARQPADCTAVDPRQATRLTHATALRDVVQHRDHRGRLQLGAQQWGPLPLRKACLAGSAVAQAHRMLLPVVPTDTQ